jgi:hypothetical protein
MLPAPSYVATLSGGVMALGSWRRWVAASIGSGTV